MCKHRMVKMGETKVCLNCGLTLLPNGTVMIDKNIVKYKTGGRKK